MLPYDKVLPINKQLVIYDLAGVLQSKKAQKNVLAKTKLEDARQLRRRYLNIQTETMEWELL